ncbi:cobyric acid synthase [Nigerium massiliense]|uniref:cobyric acid synthase n=1 Tax=Nigerium massiliense TaxID=1522317 RepID=UPI0009E24E46
MTGILIAGTSSDAGKSLVVTGLCRALARRGVRVAPFKAQNMSNNSMVCPDGAEIGRAQYLQAQAAGVEPSALLNPVLLKPGTDRRAFVVLRGRPDGVLEAGQYATGRRHLAESAFAAYRELAAAHDLVVVEGAGSPAEINLRDGDYVNMGLAREFGLPVVVVGDIDRGGVLASLYGTWALLGDDDRALLAGYVINKFRGDRSVLEPGLAEISRRTGLPCLGVLPWLAGVWLDGEDALRVDRWDAAEPAPDDLRVAVVRLPRISNATDVDALAHEPGVRVEVTEDASVAASADLLVLPGSRATVDDLAWLRERGLADAVLARHARGRPTLGICGGYEMLAERIVDDVESGAGAVPGLGVLPIEVTFADKVTTRASYRWEGLDVPGYEIHHGRCVPLAGSGRLVRPAGHEDPLAHPAGHGDPAPFLDGWRVGPTFGTMLHGSLEDDAFRRAFLTRLAHDAGHPWRPRPAPGYGAAREAMIETLADAVEEHVDLDAVLRLAAGAGRRTPGRPAAPGERTRRPARPDQKEDR